MGANEDIGNLQGWGRNLLLQFSLLIALLSETTALLGIRDGNIQVQYNIWRWQTLVRRLCTIWHRNQTLYELETGSTTICPRPSLWGKTCEICICSAQYCGQGASLSQWEGITPLVQLCCRLRVGAKMGGCKCFVHLQRHNRPHEHFDLGSLGPCTPTHA